MFLILILATILPVLITNHGLDILGKHEEKIETPMPLFNQVDRLRCECNNLTMTSSITVT